MKFILTVSLIFVSSIFWAQTVSFAPNTILFEHPQGGKNNFDRPYIPFDYNSDGQTDFIGKTLSGQYIYKGLGNNEFLPIDIDQGLHKSPLKVMDFDNDGDLDIIMENYINLYAEADSFTFVNLNLQFKTNVIDANDFNADSLSDILTIQPGKTFSDDDTLFVLTNNGNNTFSQQSIFYHKNIRATVSGDIDNDGDLDIVTVFSFSDHNMAVLINDNNQFTPIYINHSDLVGINTLTPVDIDSDGDLDILADNKIVMNSDNFQTPPQVKYLYFPDVVEISQAVDLNNDGKLDILALTRSLDNFQLSVYVSLNQGAIFGTAQLIEKFSIALSYNVTNGKYFSNNLVAYDYNNDGKKDIIYTDGFVNPGVIRYMENTTVVGTQELESSAIHLTLSPNPAKDLLNINSKTEFINNKIQILTQTGEIILSTKLKDNSIDISNLPKGYYFLNILGFETPVTTEFIKE